MRKWETINKFKVQFCNAESRFKVEEVIEILLKNRGIKTKKDKEEFLNPQLKKVSIESVGIDKKQLKKTIERIKKAIKNKEQIVVYADYDVDGVCSAAILWETLNSLGAKVVPYIPHRIDEGYGLSVKGLKNVILNLLQDLKEMPNQVRHDNKKGLIITVDNGIVANEAVQFANEQGIDVIITDHHVLPAGGSKNLPKAYSIIHTTKICAAGVTYLLTQKIKNQKSKIKNSEENKHLELVALATVADLVPLTNLNRTLLKFGLEKLRDTKRPGLLELFDEAGIYKAKIGVYEIGHIIAPRLNAMGRLEYAMDSLRLLCTKDLQRARDLANKLGQTNRERQQLTIQTVEHAILEIKNQKPKTKNLLFASHETYQQGVIGLVAGRLVEEYYKPAIVVSKGVIYSKASARSINGFNIIEFIRGASDLLVDLGGHPMAAGFTVETKKLSLLQKQLEETALELLDDEKLTRILKIDCELPFPCIDTSLHDALQCLAPFGIGNPEPVFVSRDVVIEDMRIVGRDGGHLKFRVSYEMPNQVRHDKKIMFDAIAFGMGERANEFSIGDQVDIVYTITKDVWNGNEKLQLKIKDIKSST